MTMTLLPSSRRLLADAGFRLTLICALAAFGAAQAQQGDGTDVPIRTHVFKPAKVDATPERIASLKVPAGFTIQPFATGLKNARILAVAPSGDVYVSRRDQGDVLLIRDRNADGIADGPPTTVVNRAGAHGLAIADGQLFVATVKEIFSGRIQADGSIGPLKMLVGDLPDSGQHPNRTLEVGPDNMLYVSVGSTCNACNESSPESAAMLRMPLDGSSRTIFASGLRNTIGYDWSPATGELWGLDHGIDFLGDDIQPEELNRLRAGKRYGWPHVFGAGDLNPQSTPAGQISKEQWKAMSEPMVLGYAAHAAPMQFRFYTAGMFPAEYQGDAFATMRGSWNRARASGYEIVRVRFQNGEAKAIEPFVTGFLSDGGRTHFARPVGLAVAKDGALLMADDANGVIYRVAYSGQQAAGASIPAANAGAMLEQTGKGIGVPLALRRVDATSPAKLQVRSTSFADGAAIPMIHSEYADGVSPNLSWKAVEGAKSYAVICEDPDAKPITPFVHWTAWNIPPDVLNLPEGLQEQLRLTAPEGLLQGATSKGSVGYFGPRPPAGDPAHRYHFQVFALDTLLSIPPGADRDTLLQAMQGHVLAKGEIVGRYRQAVKPPK